ncbi:MAG: alpha/beta hydrolase [Candidatus Margulisbacteria bacterium]|nr:alpha/beta hydrolase [Candidatus Margulisiibacteriota bacterium]
MKTIFLHGFATTPEVWHNQRPEFAPKLTFSDINAEARRVVGLMGGWVDRGAVLIGWSMGGMIAIQVAALAPDKIQALVLVSTTPKFIKSDDYAFGVPVVLLKRLEKRIAREGTKAFHDMIFKNGDRVGVEHLTIDEVEDELKQLEIVDLRNNLPKIKCPTMIIHGDQDEICLPGAAKYLQKNIENSELVTFSGVGHIPMIERPDEFNAQLERFVKQHAG